jgi:hypothetical protein
MTLDSKQWFAKDFRDQYSIGTGSKSQEKTMAQQWQNG